MPTVEVLGTAQDAGVPHIGCHCDQCESARTKEGQQRYAAAVLLSDGGNYLFDATPDIRFQVTTVPDGVFLTHAHLGHLPGLLFFGQEAANTERTPVYATEGLNDVIRNAPPLNLLIEQDNLTLNDLAPRATVVLDAVNVESRPVEHRESLPTGTFAYVMDGPERSLLYMTDIDEWDPTTRRLVEEVDIALVDGTFWSEDELERTEEVPHPYVKDSIRELDAEQTEIYFTHLNHTNPLLDRESEEYDRLKAAGFDTVSAGTKFEL